MSMPTCSAPLFAFLGSTSPSCALPPRHPPPHKVVVELPPYVDGRFVSAEAAPVLASWEDGTWPQIGPVPPGHGPVEASKRARPLSRGRRQAWAVIFTTSDGAAGSLCFYGTSLLVLRCMSYLAPGAAWKLRPATGATRAHDAARLHRALTAGRTHGVLVDFEITLPLQRG